MKKRILTLVVLLALMGLVACGNAQTSPESAEPQSSDAGFATTVQPTAQPDSAQPSSAASETLPASDVWDPSSDTSTPLDDATAPEEDEDPVDALPAPDTAASSGSAAATAYGAVPFELAAGTDKWWKIDSTDTAYWAVQENINAMRAAGGLPALTMDDTLSATASSRCESFVAGGPFDHSGMVTKSEICASGPLFSAADVCTAWQNSETHYANIMRTDISSMGVGCWFCDVNGNKYTYWTVTFE